MAEIREYLYKVHFVFGQMHIVKSFDPPIPFMRWLERQTYIFVDGLILPTSLIEYIECDGNE